MFERYYSKLNGVTAACGVVINSISSHAMKRLIQRGISEDMAYDLIVNASITYPGNTPGTICQQKDGFRIVINTATGNIITAIDLDLEE